MWHFWNKSSLKTFLHAPLILKELITLGEKLKADRISVREIIKDLDDEEADIDEDKAARLMVDTP